MTLRFKILFSFVALTLLNGLLALTVLEGAYLSGGTFHPEDSDSFFAPGFWQVAATMLAGIVVLSVVLFWSIKRQVLDPANEIIAATSKLGAGELSTIRSANRRDEMGRLCAAFNTMAASISDSRHRLDDKIRAATEKVERTQRELAFAERLAATGRLAAGVAQEMNVPLGGVANALSRMRKGNLSPEKMNESYIICEDGLKRIQGILRRLLDLSRKRPEIKPVSVIIPLRQSIEFLRHLMLPNHIQLAINIDDSIANSTQFEVMADSSDLQHVFLNLLLNAVDAMPSGGILTVNVYRAAKWVVTEIIDTGVGLSLEELSASFDYFHTTKPIGKGAGLGLSIAHHIVVGYRGALTLNSRKGEGTKASVELPAAGDRSRATTIYHRAPISATRFLSQAGGASK